jgi:hypothetical protein
LAEHRGGAVDDQRPRIHQRCGQRLVWRARDAGAGRRCARGDRQSQSDDLRRSFHVPWPVRPRA